MKKTKKIETMRILDIFHNGKTWIANCENINSDIFELEITDYQANKLKAQGVKIFE